MLLLVVFVAYVKAKVIKFGLIVECFDHVHMHVVDGLVFFHKIFKLFF
jgi:hypothetical protein